MINSLRDIVGAANVLEDQESLAFYSTDQSLTPPQKPQAVVKPKSSEEVQELVQYTNKTSTPLVPVSSGIHF